MPNITFPKRFSWISMKLRLLVWNPRQKRINFWAFYVVCFVVRSKPRVLLSKLWSHRGKVGIPQTSYYHLARGPFSTVTCWNEWSILTAQTQHVTRHLARCFLIRYSRWLVMVRRWIFWSTQPRATIRPEHSVIKFDKMTHRRQAVN